MTVESLSKRIIITLESDIDNKLILAITSILLEVLDGVMEIESPVMSTGEVLVVD